MSFFFDSEEERNAFYQKLRSEQKEEVKKENSIYDPNFEKTIQNRLHNLDQRSIDEFYRIRDNRKEDENSSFSNKELDLFLLESLESSYKFRMQHKQKLKNVEVITTNEIDNNIELSPFEIKLLDYINGRSATNIDLPGYFTCEFNLNLNTSINRLTKGGFVILADLDFTLHKAKVNELKNFLEQNKLKKTGTKDILISRIYDNFDKKEITDYFSERYFCVTEKGNLIIEQNPHIFFTHNYHNQLGISIKEIYEYRLSSHNDDFHLDLIEMILARAKKHIEKENWSSYRSDLYALSIIYRDMKDYLLESTFIMFVSYYDYQDTLHSFVQHFLLNVQNSLKNGSFTIKELENSFFEHNFDLFPCEIDKQTFFNIFIDEITSEENNL